MMGSRVLVVDDDRSVLSGLRRAFALEGYDVAVAEDGETALGLIAADAPDLLVLDVMLPGLDGLSVCERVRGVAPLPILMLTARDTVADRVAGLDRGADDYLVKPFALDELLARARALLRRPARVAGEVLRYADVTLDSTTRQASRAGEPLPLSPREFGLLQVFLRHPRAALTREELCRTVWGEEFDGESNFVDVAVMELRKKLEAGGRPRLIQTLRGYGYALREA